MLSAFHKKEELLKLEIEESELILREVIALVKEMLIQCDLEEAGDSKFEFEQLEAVIEMRKQIAEIEKKLERNENKQAQEILNKAERIAQNALSFTESFFENSSEEFRPQLKIKLANLVPSDDSKSIPTSPIHTSEKKKKRKKSKPETTISESDVSNTSKPEDKTTIIGCIGLVKPLEGKIQNEDAKMKLAVIKELLSKAGQFNFSSTILDPFIQVIQGKLIAAYKTKELTVENAKEFASSSAKASQELAVSNAKASQELAFSNAQVAEKAASEKLQEIRENNEQLEEVRGKLAEEEKAIKSIEAIREKASRDIRFDRNALLVEIVKCIKPLENVELTQSVSKLESIADEEFHSLSDDSLTDEEKEKKKGTELFDEIVSDVINTLERNKNDIKNDLINKIKVCDKEIEVLEGKIQEEDFINTLTSLDKDDPLRNLLGETIKNVKKHEGIDAKEPAYHILLDMERRNVSNAVEQSLKSKNHDLIVPSEDKYVFAKDAKDFCSLKDQEIVCSLENKKIERSVFQKALDSLSSICSRIKEEVKTSLNFRGKTETKSVQDIEQAKINREKAEQEIPKHSELLVILTDKKATLEQQIIDLGAKKDSAIAERDRLDKTIPEELASRKAEISAEYGRFDVIISAEQKRLEGITQEEKKGTLEELENIALGTKPLSSSALSPVEKRSVDSSTSDAGRRPCFFSFPTINSEEKKTPPVPPLNGVSVSP
jgi:hypothetical protein